MDLSETGIGILSDSITADGLHACYSNDMISATQLEMELVLPQGVVKIVGKTCRYQKLETARLNEFRYLLGVKIVEMAERDRQIYRKFLFEIKRDPSRRTPRY